MELIIDKANYTFVTGLGGFGTITFAGLGFTLELANIIEIQNITDGRRPEVYDDTKVGFGGTLAGSILTLETVTTGMDSSDDLQIKVLLTEDQAVSLFGTSGGGGGGGINTVTFGARTPVNVTDVSTEVIPANAARKGAIINNEDGNDCWISFGDDPVAEEDLKLAKKGSLIISGDLNTTQVINAICKGGKSTLLTYQEGT